MPRTRNENGVDIPLTSAEEIARDAEEAKWESEKPARAFEKLRGERNRKLQETDWTAVPDTALSDDDKKKWTDYRKLLRDLPGTLDDTKVQQDITWPSKP